MKQSKAQAIVKMLSEAKESDLDEVDAQIKELQVELKGLEAVRECLAERVLNNVKTPHKQILISPSGESYLNRILKYLRLDGPSTIAIIAKKFGLKLIFVEELLTDCEWFEKDHKMWKLTAKGYAHLENQKHEGS